uniref:Uncharacterized protein n=1 Tax=Kalanchoe fedtschenkoi TaxID=63787 RepID=A0A7N0V4G3_KALFE
MLMPETSESESEKKSGESGKKQWGFSAFKKWKRSSSQDEMTTPLPSEVKSGFVDGFVRVEALDSSKQIERQLKSEPELEKVRMLSSVLLVSVLIQDTNIDKPGNLLE